MKRYKFIKDRTASPKEVFENLKNGGLKLLCFNQVTGLWSQVAWCGENTIDFTSNLAYGDNTIEVITIKDDKCYAEYFEHFSYHDLLQLKSNTNFFKNKTWWLGYIED